jgi:hypothetical protein
MNIRFLHVENSIIDYWHPACSSGGGVVRIIGTGRIIDAATLRADSGSKIVTDDPEAVCRALGIHFPDPQVMQE